MMPATVTFRSERVVTPDGLRAATVRVRNGMIVDVADHGAATTGTVIDAGNDVVAPGLVDMDVHVNEPGRTRWEGFATATRAAAAGGVTTLLDMPLNCIPPTTTVDALERKRAAASGQCHVDVGFWGGAVPDNLDELADLHAAGVFGFKAFMVESGVDEFAAVTCDELERAMTRLADMDGLTLVHAEDADVIAEAAAVWDDGDPRHYATYLASRPDEAERRAVAQVASIARRTGARAHVLHLSSATALAPLRDAIDGGVALTAETCPHYLSFDAEMMAAGATVFACAPPIRDTVNRDRLWAALADGTIGVISTDHSPCPPALKALGTGDFAAAWGGIASLQLGLAAVWTQAQARRLPLEHVIRWMSTAPAELVGLRGKGALAPGNDADIVIWDPDSTWTVAAAGLQHRHPITPYDRMRLRGQVRATYLRGEPVYDGRVVGPPTGRLLTKEPA